MSRPATQGMAAIAPALQQLLNLGLAPNVQELAGAGIDLANIDAGFDASSLEGLSLQERWTALVGDMSDELVDALQPIFYKGEGAYPSRCICNNCLAYFYSAKDQQVSCRVYASKINALEASRILDQHADDIFQSQARLRQIMEQHGDQISHYWRASDQRTRGALLHATYPEVPQTKCFDAGRPLVEIRRSASQRNLLLPYLNADTFSKDPEALLGLVRHRVGSHPEGWAAFDSEQLRRSWVLGLLDAQFKPGAVIMHGSRYGR